jgi:hypothetical protein
MSCCAGERRRCDASSGRRDVQDVKSELDQTLDTYKAAVEDWIAAIREEEALASVNHTIVQFDQWEAAHFKEDSIRNKVKTAKKHYEEALNRKFFNF